MTWVSNMKIRIEDILNKADDAFCHLLADMTWGLSVLLSLSVIWLCFG